MSDRPVIEKGKIKVNSVEQIIDHEDCQVWLVDCRSKYFDVSPGYMTEIDGSENVFVDLWAGVRTLKQDESQTSQFTRIRFPASEKRWAVVADGGRYEARIVLYSLDARYDS